MKKVMTVRQSFFTKTASAELDIFLFFGQYGNYINVTIILVNNHFCVRCEGPLEIYVPIS